MPYIAEIVTKINMALNAGLPYDNSRYIGIAYPYPEVRGSDTLVKIVPAVINPQDGEADELVDINDDYSIKVYHRLITNTYQYVQAQFGNDLMQKWTADMHMTVIAMREQLVGFNPDYSNDFSYNLTAEELEQKMISLFPTTVMLANRAGVKALLLQPYQSDMDFIQVFRDEFKQVNYFLKPEHILFKIRYKITADINPDCLNA